MIWNNIVRKTKKKILLITVIVAVSFITGCNEPSTDTNTVTITPDVAETTVVTEDNKTETPTFDTSELSGTWNSVNGAPLVLNADGTAESPSANKTGTYKITNNELVVSCSETYSETHKIKNENSKISLIMGEEPLIYVYTKELRRTY